MQPHSNRVPYFPENLDDYAPWVAKHGLLAPYGECQCGCGENASVATRSESSRGYRKGHPKRYLHRHRRSVSRVREPELDCVYGKNVRAIPLTQGKVAIVDASDYEWLMQWNWCAKRGHKGKTYYAVRSFRLDGKSICQKIHQLIAGEGCDHINGDGLDNRRCNLRPASRGQNQCNVGLRSDNTSGYKGVHWVKAVGIWRAEIKFSGTRRHLGYFQDPEDAARAYDGAAKEMHGEFARTNFPDGNQRKIGG